MLTHECHLNTISVWSDFGPLLNRRPVRAMNAWRTLKVGFALMSLAVAQGLCAQETKPPLPPGQIVLTPIDFVQLLAVRSLELTYGRETVLVAKSLAEAEAALYEPVLFASTKVSSTERQRTSEEKTVNFTAVNENALYEDGKTAELGVRQRLPSGGELAVSARSARRNSNILLKAGVELEVNSGLVLTLKQPLMRGRGVGITETDRRVSELELVIAQWQFRQQLQKAVTEGLAVFWQAHAASESVRLRQQLLANADRFVVDAQERIEAGRLPPRAVNEAQRMRLIRHSEALKAKQSRDDLMGKLLTSVDLPYDRLPDLSLRAVPVEQSNDREMVTPQMALDQWAPYRIAGLRQAQGQVRFNFAANQQRPAVDLVMSHTQAGLSDRQGNWAWSTARSGVYPEWYVGLNFELGAGGNAKARSQAEAQQWRVIQAETERTAIQQAFLNDYYVKRDALRTVEQELRLVEDDLLLRENFLSQERLRVAVGGATLVNQLQAEQDWLDAQIRQVEVFGRREVARLTFMLAEGTLLLSHGVETPLPIEP